MDDTCLSRARVILRTVEPMNTKRWSIAVLTNLAILIALMYLFTRYFR